MLLCNFFLLRDSLLLKHFCGQSVRRDFFEFFGYFVAKWLVFGPNTLRLTPLFEVESYRLMYNMCAFVLISRPLFSKIFGDRKTNVYTWISSSLQDYLLRNFYRLVRKSRRKKCTNQIFSKPTFIFVSLIVQKICNSLIYV